MPLVLAFAGLAAAPSPAEAGQGGKFKWWRSERFVQELVLTPDQSARIEEVFQASWPALHAAKADLDRLETELSRLIAEGTAARPRSCSKSTASRHRAVRWGAPAP